MQAAKLMREHHVGDLVVVEELAGKRVPVGIVTDRDLVVELLAKGVDVSTVTVGDVMTRSLLAVPESEGIYDTIQFMRSKAVRRVPVVDKDGALVGIVSADDLLDLLSEEVGGLAKLAFRQQSKEKVTRVG